MIYIRDFNALKSITYYKGMIMLKLWKDIPYPDEKKSICWKNIAPKSQYGSVLL